MSKSRGNVQDPDELVARYGADTVRLFLMFMGPWDQGGPWSPTGIGGMNKFLNRVWTIALDPHGRDAGDQTGGALPPGEEESDARDRMRAAAHRTLRDVTADYDDFRWNTMIAKLMELSNLLFRYRGTSVAGLPEWDEAVRLLLLMLAPAAPHITEEIWSRLAAARGEAWESIHVQRWPEVDEAAVVEATREVPIQVNGKLRDRVTVPAGISDTELEKVILARDKVQAALDGREPRPHHPRGRRQARQHRRPLAGAGSRRRARPEELLMSYEPASHPVRLDGLPRLRPQRPAPARHVPGAVAQLRRHDAGCETARDRARCVRPGDHPLRPRQQLRAALRQRRGQLRTHPARGPRRPPRRAADLLQGRLGHVAGPVRPGRRLAQVHAREPGPEPPARRRGLLRHLLLAPLRPRHAARGDRGRAGHRRPPGQGAVRRASRPTRRARPSRWRRSCTRRACRC